MSRSLRAVSLCLLLLSRAVAVWAAPPSIEARVESVTPVGYRVLVSFPDPIVTSGEIFGERLAEISLPGGAYEEPGGMPQVPSAGLLLRIPWGVDARVIAIPGGERSLGVMRPVPVPGLLSHREVWASVGAARLARFLIGPAYHGLAAEEPLLERATPAASGAERVLQVTLEPIRWDPRSGEARTLTQAALEVSWDRPVRAEALPRATPPLGAPTGPLARASVLRAGAGVFGPSYAPRAIRIETAYAGPLRVQPNRPWVRLGILRPGLYAMSSVDLAAARVAVAGIDPASFRIFRATPGDLPESVSVEAAPDSLRECAIVVTGEGDGAFDPADRIYFYATGTTGFGYDLKLDGGVNYEEPERSDEESLWLTWGPGPVASPPRRMASRDASPVSSAPLVSSVPHRVHFEENRIQDFNLFRPSLRWDRWFYRRISQGSRLAFPLVLPGAEPGGSGSLVLRMWGKGISVGANFADHYTNLYWDRALVASASWDFSEPKDIVASGFLVYASDTLQVEIPRFFDPADTNRSDQSDLAWWEVTYPRRLAAINDTLQFAADTTVSGTVHYSISGISDTSAVWLLDRTNPESPVRLVGGTFAGASAPFSLLAEDSVAAGGPRRYALGSTGRAQRPSAISRYAPPSTAHTVGDLLDPLNGADYIVIAPPALLASAESLATYRANRLSGIGAPRVAIATADRIAAQLGAGYLHPPAIRNFLAYARLHWTAPAPTYVCLLGDASLDPKNYLGFGSPDWVPTYASYRDVLTQFTSDDFYGFLDGPGDLLLDLAIGRLPAKTAAEAQTLTAGKLRAYEEGAELDPWRARALLCADDAWQRRQTDLLDPLGNTHVMEMERKDHQHLPYPVERSKVYLNDYAFADTTHQSKPAAREDLIARINQGNWLVDYIGHGSDLVIADEQVFRYTDVGRLTNASRPSVFGFFSCTVGKFDALGQEGLGELLLKSPTGGAAASLAATELVFPPESTELNDEFVDQLFPFAPRVDSTLTVGLAWALAKNAHRNSVVRKYVLLGDPALTPPIPRGRGVWEKAPEDSLLRGDLAILRGHALYSDSTRDTLSSGTALIQVEGKPIQRVQIGYLNGNLVPFPYDVPGSVLFRGTVGLSRGAFEAQFVVPMDGRIAGGVGKLRALLSAAGGRGVGLVVDSIRIAQGTGTRTDLVPPSVALLYPAGADSSVQPGDRITIAIEDSSGIDLMRLDNAHTIFVIVDDRGSPTEITPGFSYDPGSHTRGTVPYGVPQLAEGLHTLEIHASDTFGNIGVRTFVLDVHAPARPGDPVQLTQVFNYPNPFEGVTYIHARLNQGARLKVRILTVAGRRVRELTTDGRAGENYLPWDGKDSAGENVAIGVYLIHVTAESPAGKRATAIGRALRTR